MYSKIAAFSDDLVGQILRLSSSVWRLAKKLSAMALSSALPTLPMLPMTPLFSRCLPTRRPFCPYYVLNIADERIPFTGVIGMSSLVDTAETAGLHLTYLPKYLLSDDAALRRPDEDVKAEFMAGFRRMFPDLPDSDIAGVHLNRAVKVQPLQVLGYSGLVQPPRTLNSDFYVVNTAQFASNTLNNNEVIRSVNAFLEQFEPEFRSAA